MKLLVCAQEYPPLYSSGIGHVAYNVVEELKKSGVSCTVCSPTGPDVKIGSSGTIQRFGILGLLSYWNKVAAHFDNQSNDFDVVWLHNPVFVVNSWRKKSLVTMNSTYRGMGIRGMYSLPFCLLYKASSQFEKRSLNNMDIKDVKFTAVSRQVSSEIAQIGVDHTRITYIPNGVDVNRFKPALNKWELRRKFSLPEDGIVILSIGRLTEQKEPYRLIRVFAEVSKAMKNVVLVVAGKGDLLAGSKRLAQQVGLENIKFLGHVDYAKDIPDLYACSDYFAAASKYEGGEPTLTLAEAMASGLPCIVSDISPFKIVKDANCGIVVDYKDTARTASDVINYINIGNSEHSKNARGYAVNNLSWETISGKYLQEFKGLLSK